MASSPLCDIAVEKKRKLELTKELKARSAKLKAQASFDASFWSTAVELEDTHLKVYESDRKVSIVESKLSEDEWKETPEAQRFSEQIKASEQTKKIYKKRREALQKRESPARTAFMKLFVSSKIGLGIRTTGVGKRPTADQANFRQALIEVHDAKEPGYDALWCPIMGEYLDSDLVVASHLFAWGHGQDAMDAIFGRKAQSELFSPRNGLLLPVHIEKVFDIGKLAIVPHLPESTCMSIETIKTWLLNEPRDYQVKILDQKWDRLDDRVYRLHPLTFRDLDGRKLQFRTSFRPSARYVYFHYCIQVLRHAWQHNEAKAGQRAADSLKHEDGRPFWCTPGRYLPKNMLLAFVEELGHEYKPLLQGASCPTVGNSDLLLEVAANQVKNRSSILDTNQEAPEDEQSTDDDGSNGDDLSFEYSSWVEKD